MTLRRRGAREATIRLMRLIALTLAAILGSAPLIAATDQEKNTERFTDARDLFEEVMGTPDKAIPQDLLEKAACIVIVPGLKKAAFGIGGKYGRGFVLCRAGAGAPGWGPPAAIRVEGGGIGFQIGVSSSDVILLVMNQRGMKKLTSSKFTVRRRCGRRGGSGGSQRQRTNRRLYERRDSFLVAIQGALCRNLVGWGYTAPGYRRERDHVRPPLDQQADSGLGSKAAGRGV